LEYVLESWNSDTCDLWEEIKANDLLWNLMAYHFTLKKAINFAKIMDEEDLANKY